MALAISDLHIPNAELAGQESNGQEEADDKHGNAREHPGNGLQAAVAETLENTRSNEAHHRPPDHRAHCTYSHMVEHAGDGHQKNRTSRLAETERIHIYGPLRIY